MDVSERYKSQSIRLKELEEDYSHRGVQLDDLANQFARSKTVADSKITDLRKCCDALKSDLDQEKIKSYEFSGLQAKFESQSERMAQIDKRHSLRGEEIDRLQGQVSSLRSSFNETIDENNSRIEALTKDIEMLSTSCTHADVVCNDLKVQIRVTENELQCSLDIYNRAVKEHHSTKDALVQACTLLEDKDRMLLTQSVAIDNATKSFSNLLAEVEFIEVHKVMESLCNSVVDSINLSTERSLLLENNALREQLVVIVEAKDILNRKNIEMEVDSTIESLINRTESCYLSKSLEELDTRSGELHTRVISLSENLCSEQIAREELEVQISVTTITNQVASTFLEEKINTLNSEVALHLKESLQNQRHITLLRAQHDTDALDIQVCSKIVRDKESTIKKLQQSLDDALSAKDLLVSKLEQERIELKFHFESRLNELNNKLLRSAEANSRQVERIANFSLMSNEFETLKIENDSLKAQVALHLLSPFSQKMSDDIHLLSIENTDHGCTGNKYSTYENIPNNLCSEDFEINFTQKSILLASTDFDLNNLDGKSFTKKRKVTFGETTFIPLVDSGAEDQNSPTNFVNPIVDTNASQSQKTRPQKLKHSEKDNTPKRRKRREVMSLKSDFGPVESSLTHFRFEPNMQFVPIFEL